MAKNENFVEPRAWQKADARVLGQILAAQNVDFALPDNTHIAEFYAETLITIPGIKACCVCLADVIIQKGDMAPDVYLECQAMDKNADIYRQLVSRPDLQLNEIDSLHHHFGFFVFQLADADTFNIYKPFIGNLANYLALSLENRLQSELLQNARDELERRVEERTKDLVATNASLQEEIERRRQLEAALRESERQIKQLIDASPIAMAVVSEREKRIEWVNDKFVALFGYTLQDVPDIKHWWPNAYPDRGYQAEIKSYSEEKIKKAAGTKNQVDSMEAMVTCKDGSQRYIEFSLSFVGQKQIVTFVDLTERKQAEENLRLLSAALEAAANGILITDRNGTITWVNPAFTRLTGYTVQESIGQNPRILKSGKQDRLFYENLWNTILSGKIWHGEQINRHKDGHNYVEDMTIAPVQQRRGEISHFVAIKQDVSERKRHEQEREAIISVADAMRSTSTFTELVAIFLNQIKDLFAADGTMLAVQNTVTGEAIIEMGCGPAGERFSGIHIPLGEGICNQVITSGKPYLNNMATTDPAFYRPDLLGDAHSAACIPLIAQEKIIGALWLIREKEIVESEVSLLTAIANLAANAIHRVKLHEQTEQQLHQMAALHQIDMAINADFDLKNVLVVLLNNVIARLDVDAADVLLLTPDGQAVEYAAGVGFRTANIEKSRVMIGEGRVGSAAAERRTISLPNLDEAQDTFSRTVLLSDERFVSHIVAPLIAKGQVKGVLEVFKRTLLNPTSEWFDFFETLATQAAIGIENTSLFNDLQLSNQELIQAYQATIEGWAHALDLRDKETEGHTRRVTEMTLRLAKAMGVDENNLVIMQRGAILHDIGKMAIPDDILFKPSYLTDEEWVIMRKHPAYAYEMLSPIHYLQPALNIPYCHHEKWDGSGYPRGLKGEEIPLEARIFAVIDVWDALCSNRRYREAWDESKALSYICDQAGKQFDPEVVKAFLTVQPWKVDRSTG